MAMDRPWISTGFKVAKIGVEDTPALLIQRTARIRGLDFEQEFVLSLLRDKAFERHCTVTGSLVPHISHKDILSYKVITPPLALQREFAAFVAKVDKLAFKAKASLEKLETLKKAMMQKYFN
jgi:type I restriction enzyme S subunit